MADEDKRISSLRDLPRDIQPSRDLWSGIEARIAQEPRGKSQNTVAIKATPRRRWSNPGTLRVLAAAAMIATLAVGIWIGRSVLPDAGQKPAPVVASNNGKPTANVVQGAAPGEASAFQAAYLMNSKYTQERAELVKDLDARLAGLPPDSRAKVIASLKTISDSKRDLENELGKDPSNALLQGLLVNTYQDEMRVLTAVHEAGGPGKGI